MYLGGDANGWRLLNNVYGAVLFDQDPVQLSRTLTLLRGATGLTLEAVPLRLEAVFETCDRCRAMVIPLVAFFDGREFLCPDCRNQSIA